MNFIKLLQSSVFYANNCVFYSKINSMHLGKNIERICKLTGIKQSDLAKRLNTNQQEISRIENKAEIKDELLERISKAIGFPKEVIQAFSDEKLINSINQLGGDGIVQFINPIEKIIELYERQLIEKDKRIALLENQLKITHTNFDI